MDMKRIAALALTGALLLCRPAPAALLPTIRRPPPPAARVGGDQRGAGLVPPTPSHAFLYDAIEKGYFEEEGLKVNIQFPPTPTTPCPWWPPGRRRSACNTSRT